MVGSLPKILRRSLVSPFNDPQSPYPVYGSNQVVQPHDEVLLHQGYGQAGRHTGWDIYDRWLLADPHIHAVLQKRYSAVSCREWVVQPASDKRQDKKAADLVRRQLENLSATLPEDTEAVISTSGGFDQSCVGLLDAIVKGFAVGEIVWDNDGEVIARELRIHPQRRFTFLSAENGYKLRLLTSQSPYDGEPLPAKKFVVHRVGVTDDPFGAGLGSKLFWCKWFKSQDIKFWLAFVDRFASPLPIGKYPQGRMDIRDDLLDAMRAIAHEAGIAIPEDSTLDFLDADKSGSVTCYKDLADYMDREISKAVLGETGTTDQQGSGGSRARDAIGNEVRLEIAKSDADLLSETLNRTLARWITEFNLPDAQPPTIWRRFKDLEDSDPDERIGRDKQLLDYGYRLTPDKVVEIYGDGYEPVTKIEDNVPALITTLGDTATQQLMSFLQQGSGSMPRENAIAILNSVFGIPEDKAELMVPVPQEDPNSPENQLAGIFGGDEEVAPAEPAAETPTEEPAPEEPTPEEDTEASVEASEIEFRMASSKAVPKKKNCVKGYYCPTGKGACINRDKQCRVELKGNAKASQDWLKTEAEQLRAQLAALQSRLAEVESAKPKPGSVVDVPVTELNFDPDRFQYKLVHGATGSSGSLTGVKTWDPNLAGVVQAWVDPADGKTYVVNGHNRANLAKNLGVDSITVRYLDVKDAQEARAVGALTNIAEGRGNALDAAKFFKDSGMTREDLQRKGIPMREKIATDGLALSELEDNLFRRVIDGDLPQERAVIIGGSGLSKDDQRSLMDLIDQQEKRGRKITNEVISELTDVVKSSATQTEQQFDLFGSSEVTKNLAIEKATLQAAIRKKLSREKKLFGTVAKSRAAQELEKAGNQIDVEKSKGVSEQAAQTLAVFDQLKNLSGPVSSLINQASERIANGENVNKVQDELYKSLVSRLPDILKGKTPEFAELMDQVWETIANAND